MKMYLRLSADQKKDFDEESCQRVTHTLQYQETMETKCLFADLNAFRAHCTGDLAKLKKQVTRRRGPEGNFHRGHLHQVRGQLGGQRWDLRLALRYPCNVITLAMKGILTL